MKLRKEQLNVLKSYWSTYSYTATAGTTSTALPVGFEAATITQVSGGNHTSATPVRGIVTTSPGGYVSLRKQSSGQTPDDSGTAVFGRLTYSGGTYTVNYKKLSSGSEVSATLSGTGTYLLQMLFPEVMTFAEAPTNSHVTSEEFVGSSSVTGTGGSPSGSAGGDLGASFPSPTVVGLTNVISDLTFNQSATATISPAIPGSSGSGRDLVVRAGQRNTSGTPGALYLNSGGTSTTTGSVNLGTDGYSNINVGASAGTKPINLYGTISANNFKITNLASPTTASADAAPATYVEAVAQVMTSDYKFFVSPNGNDSYSGKSWGRPFATIAAAVSALGANRGSIVLLPGIHAPVGAGFRLRYLYQTIIGEAFPTTRINCTGITTSYCLRSEGGRGGFADLQLVSIPAGATAVQWGLGSAVNAGSNQNGGGFNLLVETMGANSVAFGIGNSDDSGLFGGASGTTPVGSATDVSNIQLFNCRCNGVSTTYGCIVGNGAIGNTLGNNGYGCTFSGNFAGIKFNGGSMCFYGTNFGQNDGYDIWIKRLSSGATLVDGGRSESSRIFIFEDFANRTSAGMMKVSNISATALINTDGKGIVRAITPLKIDNVRVTGATCPQYIYTGRGSSDSDIFESFLDVDGFASEHPHPFQSPWAHPGMRIRSRNTRFLEDINFQTGPQQTPERWIRRLVRSDSTAFTINPAHYEEIDIRLNSVSGSFTAGTFTINNGIPGQKFKINFEQDGYGGCGYSWPTSCVFTSGVPSNVLTARSRQTCEFQWTGRYWLQCSPVMTGTPYTIPSNSVTDNFASGNPYWLGTPAGSAYPWVSVPGGGAMGITGGKCTVKCLGFLGDKDTDVVNGFAGNTKAAYVIETGMSTTPVGISATFVWQIDEGIIAHYIDDLTFCLFSLQSTNLIVRAYSNGVGVSSWTANLALGSSPTAGSTYTLLIKLTSNGYEATLTGPSGNITIGGLSTYIKSNIATVNPIHMAVMLDGTQHGIVSGSLSGSFSAFSVS